jgi:hypothetical protein
MDRRGKTRLVSIKTRSGLIRYVSEKRKKIMDKSPSLERCRELLEKYPAPREFWEDDKHVS